MRGGPAFATASADGSAPASPPVVGSVADATTVRGSLESGNRAQYAINWNLRVSRRFTLPLGGLTVSADVLNVTNAGERLQENDLSGTSFNLRLPLSIQPPRLVRIGLRYEF